MPDRTRILFVIVAFIAICLVMWSAIRIVSRGATPRNLVTFLVIYFGTITGVAVFLRTRGAPVSTCLGLYAYPAALMLAAFLFAPRASGNENPGKQGPGTEKSEKSSPDPGAIQRNRDASLAILAMTESVDSSPAFTDAAFEVLEPGECKNAREPESGGDGP